jgi:Tol biopolymer transport system component/DNA-binding winged helix-turn-helix (wHTH) protein
MAAMGNAFKQLLEFGPFQLDPEKRLLLRDQQLIPLSPKAFDLLMVLVSRSGQVVTKDDLMKVLWPNTFVEESNLGQHVFQLRKALGERPQDHSYIVTVPGRGYRFVPAVRALPVATEEIVVHSHSRARMVIEEETLPARPSPHTAAHIATTTAARAATQTATQTEVRTATKRRIHPALVLAGVAVVTAIAFAFRPAVPAPTVTRIRQLTHVGNLIYNTRLLSDGPRIYIRTWEGQLRAHRYVSTEGGEVFPIDAAFPRMDVDDVSPNGSEFLILEFDDAHDPITGGAHALWRVEISSGSRRPVGTVRALDARYSPDGRTIAYSQANELDLVNPDGSHPRKLVSLPGQPFYPMWSRDGRSLRFTLWEAHGQGSALWQTDLSGNLTPVLPDWSPPTRPRPGDWTPDSRYFIFTSQGEGTRDIWAIQESHEFLRRVNPKPVRLTAGPLNFFYPTPSKDGKSIFAVGVQDRGQLMRFDAASRQYVPYARGISADHVAFSRDGQWMAYVEDPQSVLVRSRLDGSERRQLTFPPMHVFHPQWSPDGTQLAFQASADQGAPDKIYTVSRDGGLPLLATPPRSDQQLYPSWSSNGEAITFSGSDETGDHQALYRLDLKSKQVSQFPATEGLYWGQISPDGLHIVALSYPAQKLMLYDTASHDTQTLAELADYPTWSADGKYVYFSKLYFRGDDAGIYRWQLSNRQLEKVMGSPDFRLGGIWGVWYGLTPGGDPLVLRDTGSTDLYALDLDLP